jgi:hypothetical protein
MAESLLIKLGSSRRRAVNMVARPGGQGVHNPVARHVLGFPSESGVGAAGAAADSGPAARPPSTPSGRENATASAVESVQDKLFKRLLFADAVGYGVPGPGVLTGAAFRSALRSMGEERGGLVGMDVTNLSPEEERALPILLDPEWVARQRRSQQP